MGQSLEKEFNYYVENQNELVKKYNGKVLVIKNREVIGVYGDELEAIEKTQNDHALGSFLVQKCESGEDNYTQTFHSRVRFYGA